MDVQISGNDCVRIVKYGGQWIIFVRYKAIPNKDFDYGVFSSLVTMS